MVSDNGPHTTMQIKRQDLEDAAQRGLLTPDQAQALWAHLSARGMAAAPPTGVAAAPSANRDDTDDTDDTPRFKPAHILYYLGGMTAIGAMTLFMTLGWEQFGGGGLLALALVYGAVATGLTEWLLRRPGLALPAGITAALAVVMVPLAVYGLQHAMGWWPDDGGQGRAYRDFHTRIDWRWLMMELATLAAGAVALWRWRRPFAVMPVAVTLWYMGMDLVPFLLGGEVGSFFSDQGKRIALAWGAVVVLIAFWVDLRSRGRPDFAFWLYLCGALSFWGALSSMHSTSEWSKLGYCAINLGLIALGAALSRRVFAVLGGLGVAGYLGHLSHTVFKDSLLFPLALTLIGLGVIGAGIVWQRHGDAWGQRLRQALPVAWPDRR